jgi:hypothetical protein
MLRESGMNFGRALSIGRGKFGVELTQCTGGCWGFWAWRARISVDILGLGAN